MGKLSGLKAAVEAAEKALDMSQAARMQRARDMGFDTEIKYIHESPSDTPLQEIRNDGRFGGIFALPDERAGYYPNTQEFYLKSEPFSDTDIYRIYDERPDEVGDLIRREFGDDVDVDEYLDYAATFDNIPYELIEDDRYADLQKLRANIARIGGAEAVTQPDEFSNTVQLLGGSGVRNVNAAFDPAKKGSSNLLASLGGAAVLGGAALGSDKADAGVIGGTKRLYRGLRNKLDPSYDPSLTDAPHGYSTWTDNPYLAREYAGESGTVYEVNLPESELGIDLIDRDGERALFVNNQKAAGINGVSGDEYLLYQDHENFSADMISVAKKYGISTVAAGAVLAGTMTPRQAQAQSIVADFAQRRSAKNEYWKQLKNTVLEGMAAVNRGAEEAQAMADFASRRAKKQQTWQDVRDAIAQLKPQPLESVVGVSNEGAAALADYAGKYNQFIEDRPLLSVVAPEAPEELLNKIAYDDDKSVGDYVWAGVGMAP